MSCAQTDALGKWVQLSGTYNGASNATNCDTSLGPCNTSQPFWAANQILVGGVDPSPDGWGASWSYTDFYVDNASVIAG